MEALNGWHRIGIVVSTAWMTIAILYARFSIPVWKLLPLHIVENSTLPEDILNSVTLPVFGPVALLWIGGYVFVWIKRGFCKHSINGVPAPSK